MNPGQQAIADGMALVAKEINAQQVFMLGDNFYGLPPTGPDEARFNGTFEEVYNAPSLKDIPFWAIAGNHDWGGNVSEQIAYTESPQNAPPLKDGGGGRWRYPDFWYNVTQVRLPACDSVSQASQPQPVRMNLTFVHLDICVGFIRGNDWLGFAGPVRRL